MSRYQKNASQCQTVRSMSAKQCLVLPSNEDCRGQVFVFYHLSEFSPTPASCHHPAQQCDAARASAAGYATRIRNVAHCVQGGGPGAPGGSPPARRFVRQSRVAVSRRRETTAGAELTLRGAGGANGASLSPPRRVCLRRTPPIQKRRAESVGGDADRPIKNCLLRNK